MHVNSELVFRKYALPYFKSGMRVLEIGPDFIPSIYEKVVSENTNNTVKWETIDINRTERTTYAAISEYSMPLPDDTFDIIMSGQVIEHVRKTWLWMRELVRVCKPGGCVITIGPVRWPFHEAPNVPDCWRVYPAGMRSLYDDAGLDVKVCERASLHLENRTGWRNYAYDCLDLVRMPRSTLRHVLRGKQDWKEWFAEDTIAIGVKK